MIVAIFMFFVCWSCAFIAFDRIRDIILANRDKQNDSGDKADPKELIELTKPIDDEDEQIDLAKRDK